MAVDGVQNDPNQPKGVKKEVVVKQDQKLSNIFDVYDDNKNKILDNDDLQVLNSVFTNGGQKTKVTKDDLDEITKELNKNLADDQKVTTKDVENFYKNVVTAEKQGLQNGETPIVQEVEIEESSEASAQNNPQSGATQSDTTQSDTTQSDTTQSDTTQSGTKPEGQGEDEPELHPYTVQLGESFTGIIKSSLKAQGIDNPTAEQIQEAKDKFKENNEGVVKTAKNGVEYILVGTKVNLEGELEDKDNAAEQQKAWADKYGKGRKAKADGTTPDKTTPQNKPLSKEELTKAQDAAKKAGYRATDSEVFFYDEKNKIHYKWDAKEHKFIERKDVRQAYKDNSYRTVTENDGKNLETYYDKDEKITKFKLYGDNDKADVAKKCGLRATFNKDVFYDEKTKTHFRWDNNSSTFVAERDYAMIGKDGTKYDKTGKSLDEYHTQLAKDGRESQINYDDKGTIEYTYDENGNQIKEVDKDAKGKITGSHEFTYDANGKKIKQVDKDAKGNIINN